MQGALRGTPPPLCMDFMHRAFSYSYNNGWLRSLDDSIRTKPLSRDNHSCHWLPTYCVPFHQLFICVISVWVWCYWPNFIYESTRPRWIKHTGFLEGEELKLTFPHCFENGSVLKNCILGYWKNLPMYHRKSLRNHWVHMGKFLELEETGMGRFRKL